MVPDLALLEIFDLYMAEALGHDPFRHNREAWIILAHVCRKWRDIVFGSPYRLNVRLHFTSRRSVRVMLDTWRWPPLPIDIWGLGLGEWNVNNIVAALEQTDRIHKIQLCDSSLFHLEQAFAAMQRPFPSLTELAVNFYGEKAMAVPDLFLSGSAPLLRSLRLRCTRFPPPLLRHLLLSTTDLVELRIWRIPDSGFIPPEAMIACLSGLNRLEEFELGFQSPRFWRSRHLPRSPRCVLPALTSLLFNGSCEYLEDLIAPIDSPLLDNLDVIVFHQPELDTTQFAQFVDRTPKLKPLHEAHIIFGSIHVFVSLPRTPHRGLHFRVTVMPLYQLSVMVRLCTSSFLRTLIPMMRRLYILNSGAVEGSQWLDLLRPFTTVQDLYLSQKIPPHIVPALYGTIGEGMMEALPSLQNLFLEKKFPGPVEEVIGQFVAALRLSSRPIAVSQWGRVHDPWWLHELEDR